MRTLGTVLNPKRYVTPIGAAAPPNVLQDDSRFGNNGVHMDITWVQEPSDLWVMNFDGTQYISMPTPPLAPSLNITADLTILLCIYSTGLSAIRNLIGNGNHNFYGYRLVMINTTTFLEFKYYNPMRIFAYLVFSVCLGATLPDIDHILLPYHRSWGHNVWILLAVFLLVLVVAHFGRQIRIGVLNGRNR